MTGLDLESFLLLLRADLGVWLMLGLAIVGLAFLVWSSWRSRRALRNCLVVSLAAHLGLLVFGSTFPGLLWTITPGRRQKPDRPRIREIRVAVLADPGSHRARQAVGPSGVKKIKRDAPDPAHAPRLDLVDLPLALADPQLQVARPAVPERSASSLKPDPVQTAPPPAPNAVPKGAPLAPELRSPERRAVAETKGLADPPRPASPLPPDLPEPDDALDETKAAQADEKGRSPENESSTRATARIVALRADRRLRPGRLELGSAKPASSREGVMPGADRRSAQPRTTGASQPIARRSGGSEGGASSPELAGPDVAGSDSIPTVRATPKSRTSASGFFGLADLGERVRRGPSIEIPRIYQPRLEPDRFAQAQRTGASAASESAVERAIDWLSRHQDKDGRWDAGTARYADGSAVEGDDDFTVHCPTGETCFGECAYWEADTALTGMALLTYLGAGYTHVQGKYADNVSRGLNFLLSEQKSDGDLRGRSRVVGMYCHAMATLALCEAYALSADPRLRDPATRAVAFMVSARAADGMAWRYAPGAPAGDTSILGWVVMGLKSAREIGIPIPKDASVRRGTLDWLDKVATGESNGLARYQPSEQVTPTMTAEAWVCRQFLGIGGPGKASSEAAASLLKNESDRGASNYYYWYYATLALYQHGGDPWTQWNTRLRDQIVGLQISRGHQTGSWEPDSSLYGAKGGRIYCTALAALTLEVYYRYLRLYDEPNIPLEAKDESSNAKAKG